MRPQPLNPPRSDTRRADRWIFASLLALLVWVPLPWGSKPPAAAALVGLIAAVLACARLLIAIHGSSRPEEEYEEPSGSHALPRLPGAAWFVLVMWLVWLVWGVLYLVPLPRGLLSAISPQAAGIHEAVAALPEARALFTLSILPGATLDRLILGASYLCLFWLVLVTVARDRYRQRLVLQVLLLSGVAQAFYGIVMTLSGLEYGFLEPKAHGVGWATGTFVNRNHFAGYLELSLAAGIALVLADLTDAPAQNWKQVLANLVDLALSPRMRTRVMIAVMVIALVLTRSRMGNIAFFVALALCGNLYVLLRHPRYLFKSLLFFVSLFLVDLMIVSEQYGLQKLAERIERTDLQTEQRALAFRDLVPVIQDYGVTGSGPGTFAAAFSPHRSTELHGFFDHAHNDYVEFFIESGVVGSALLIAGASVSLFHGVLVIRRRRERMATAMGFAGTMALVALGLHSIADFNLHIPAVAATLITLMALMLSCSSQSSQRPPPPT
jgi:putative inorganic carbon (hco3(-)) transporter